MSSFLRSADNVMDDKKKLNINIHVSKIKVKLMEKKTY